MAAELVTARDLNCLADDNRQTRKRALTKLGALPSAGHSSEELAPLWADALRAPLLKLFADPVEKNRELAITLATELLAVLSDAACTDSLAHVVPAITARIGIAPAVEEAEELRHEVDSLTAQLHAKEAEAFSSSLVS